MTMFRRLCLVVAVSLLAQAAQGQTTLPIQRILLDLDDAPISQVQKIASEQAKEQWKMDKGPLYKSAPAVQNNDPNQVSDEVVFTGVIVPRSSATRLAIFSDDGCDVWIDGKLVLERYKKGQHLPDLGQSLHVLHKFKPVPGQSYLIRIRYSNTIYLGKTDIDGCTLFAYAGGADAVVPIITTEIPLAKANDPTSKTTLGTIVMADKDGVYGDKDEPALRRKVTIAPSAGKAKLTVKRTADDAADAGQVADVKLFEKEKPADGGMEFFGANNEFQTEEIDATKPRVYWLQGGTEPSKKVRFQKITAAIANVPTVDELRVTVLWVDLAGFNEGDVSTDKNGVYDGYTAAYHQVVTKNGPNLNSPPFHRGVQICGPGTRYADHAVGVIEFQGDIKPANLPKYAPAAFEEETVKFVDGTDPAFDESGGLVKAGDPAKADFGFIFRRETDVRRYKNGLTRDKELTEMKFGFRYKGNDDTPRQFQDIHPDDPNADDPKKAGQKALIVDLDYPSAGIAKDLRAFFSSTRVNFSEHVVFNFHKQVPERSSRRIKWANSLDVANGGTAPADTPPGPDEDKVVYLLGLPNTGLRPDNSPKRANAVNQVLVEGLGDDKSGMLDTLDLKLEKPVIDEKNSDFRKKEIKAGKKNIFSIEGKELIGQVLLRNKGNPADFLLPTSTRSEPLKDPRHYSSSKVLQVIFETDKAKPGQFELLIVNVAGESNAIGGFKILPED